MRKRGVPVSVAKCFPNRINPNVMAFDKRIALRDDMREDDYDPIYISPIKVYYTLEEFEEVRPFYGDIKGEGEDFGRYALYDDDTYIICDGHHRVNEARHAKMETIRAVTWKITERDAVPHFFKRHRLRGELDPLIEAKLFYNERFVKGRSMEQIVEDYGLSGEKYIRNRLYLTNVSRKVLDLLWEPPEDVPGRLTFSHLRELGLLPIAWQKVVALVALTRNWTSNDLQREQLRIRTTLMHEISPEEYVDHIDVPEEEEKRIEDMKKKLEDKFAPLEEEEKQEIREETADDDEDTTLADDLRPGEPQTPEYWAEQKPIGEVKPAPIIELAESIRRQLDEPEEKSLELPSLESIILTRERLAEFMGKVQVLAYEDDMNLNTESLPKLDALLDEAVFDYLDEGQVSALLWISLRCAQIDAVNKL